MVSFIPKSNEFFEIFQNAAVNVDKAASEFVDMLENFNERAERSKRIKDLEHAGDQITHETISLLNRTFITPFDREDILKLAGRLDDVIDLTNVAASRLVLYKIESPTQEILELARCLKHSTAVIVESMACLRKMKKIDDMIQKCVAIHTQENDADRVMQNALASLFVNFPDARDIIKWKDVYEAVEAATDRCEDVANILEGIVLKNA